MLMINKKLYKPRDIPFKSIYIIPGEPALYVSKYDAIIVNDLHLGFEEALARGLDYSDKAAKYFPGMIVPKIQLEKIKKSLKNIHKLVRSRRIIINGDLKHAFDRLLRQERREIRDLLEFIINDLGVKDLIIIRGNHDNYLKLILRDYGLELQRELEIDTGSEKILVTHGHIYVDITGYDAVIIGHEHPSLRCFGTYKLPSFLFIPTRSGNYVIVVPAIGPYQSGTTITPSASEYLSPIIKRHCIVEYGKPVTWLSNEDYPPAEEALKLPLPPLSSELLSLEEYVFETRRIVVLDFSDVETALILCGI